MWSFRNAFLAIFLALVGVPLGLFWIWPHARAVHQDLEEARDRHLVIAGNLGAALERYHEDLVSTFGYFASALFVDHDLHPARDVLASLRFTAICIVDEGTGLVLGGFAGLQPGCPFVVPADRMNRIRAHVGEGTTRMMRSEADGNGAPVLALARRQEGRIAIGWVSTSYLVEIGRRVAFGRHGHAVVVDHTGRAVAHPDPTWAFEMRDLSRLPIVQRMISGGSGVDTFFSPAFGEDMIAGYTSVRGPGWGVMVPQPKSEIAAKAGEARISALLLFAAGLLSAALIALRAALMIVEPVRHVIANTARLRSGDGGAAIEPPSRLAPVEIHQLVASFNEMAGSIADARAAETAALRRAEAASSFKTDFLRTVTHEFRSPLNAIIGFSELVLKGSGAHMLTPTQQAAIADINAGGRHLLSLTNDLLDLSRIEAGRYALNIETIGVDEIVDRCARFLAADAARRNISFETDIGDAPDLLVDERAMFQVMLNLASNAVKYGRDDGTILISAQPTESGVVLSVTDDGPGIAPEHLARVLEPFQRCETSENRHVLGSGLGLPIVKRLVELHGGTFRLDSAVGEGTCAVIVLPRTRVVPPPLPKPAAPAKSALEVAA